PPRVLLRQSFIGGLRKAAIRLPNPCRHRAHLWELGELAHGFSLSRYDARGGLGRDVPGPGDRADQQSLDYPAPDRQSGRFKPLLVMDVWEHAFMIDYKPSERAKYIEAFFSNIDWNTVDQRLTSPSSVRPVGVTRVAV